MIRDKIPSVVTSGLSEFKEFILKGNAFDLAVAFIIGAAFSGMVTSLVNDVLMPPIGFIVGGVDFSNYYADLSSFFGFKPAADSVDAAQKSGHAVIAYGKFFNALINLVIVGFVIFLLVKQLNRFRRGAEKPEKTPEEVKLLTEIRDILARDARSVLPDGH
ncbi:MULTISPECIES: large conductance mechanosensitive channel protein MscL [Rhodomicrobium]|uniref:large conductance mechanosensitive channel protein MscL n=1 Tax=Rhodomicrobium TaxID=1068 RepID=UPI000B4C1ED1|nr:MULTISPECIES: large conductance mechanosensitive channel protein MscL [Rhodomicrobium]